MGKRSPRAGKRRAKRTTLTRAALILLLLPQLAALWVLHRPSPTSLPPRIVGWVLDVALGEATARCERATIDRSGRIRLDGLVIGDPEAGLGFEGEARLAPDWRGCLGLGELRGQGAVRGRIVSADPDGPSAEEIVARVDAGESLLLTLALRAGEIRLRAELTGGPPAAAEKDEEPAETDPPWQDRRWQALARELRALEGGVELRARGDAARAEFAARGRPERSVTTPWSLGSARGRATLGPEGWSAEGRLERFRLGELQVASLAARATDGQVDVAAEGAAWSALTDIALLVRGDPFAAASEQDGLVVTAWAGESRLRSRLAIRSPIAFAVRETTGRVRAEELLRLAPVAHALASADLDFAGTLEIADGSADLGPTGVPERIGGWIAATGLGWDDIRPALIRPELPTAAVSGRARWSEALGLELSQLDIAGLRGSIAGKLGLGEAYVVRLASTPGNPVHPSCLNSLLGAWWVDLWKRFDLSTSGSWPHADVVVKGRWGEATIDSVQVGAHLERFGFMGARFAETRVRVDTTPRATVVHLDTLTGEREGRPAGGVTGSLRWDWSSGSSMPEIRAEGDLHPACGLRLASAELAQSLRGAEWGRLWTTVLIKPSGETNVRVRSDGATRVLGVEVGKFTLDLAMNPNSTDPAKLSWKGDWAGGQVDLALVGNLRDVHRIERLDVRGLRLAQLPQALPGWVKPPDAGTPPSRATVDGRLEQGEINFLDPLALQAAGNFRLVDPDLKKVRIMGGLSKGLDAVGLGVGSYQLTQARGRFAFKDQALALPDLEISGEDAELQLQGSVNFKTSGLSMEGSFRLKDSRWGPLGYLNPNRLITSVLKIRILGTLDKPEVKVRPGF